MATATGADRWTDTRAGQAGTATVLWNDQTRAREATCRAACGYTGKAMLGDTWLTPRDAVSRLWYAGNMNESEIAAVDLIADAEREVVANGGSAPSAAVRDSLTALAAACLEDDAGPYSTPPLSDSDARMLEGQGWPLSAILDLRRTN